MPAPANLVWETTPGTSSPFTLTTVARSFNNAFGTGGTDKFTFFMYNRSVPGEWMVATGHLSAATTLVLDTVIEGSNGTSAVAWSAGIKDVTNDIQAKNYILTDAANTFTLAQKIQARSNIDVSLKGYLFGLTLSTAGSSATFSIAAGEAVDNANNALMALASSLSKTTSAWAVGSGNGGLDTGTIAANTWYHAYLIKRTDTGVVDALVSLSATAPTLPTSYTLSRRIGSMRTNGSSQWTKFIQTDNTFIWDVPVNDVNATAPGTAAVTRTLSTPLGVSVEALVVAGGSTTNAGTDSPAAIYLSDLGATDSAANATTGIASAVIFDNETTGFALHVPVRVRTNTSSQIRSRLQLSAAGTVLYIDTTGWIDFRGRDA
jgi:hypothetical protein